MDREVAITLLTEKVAATSRPVLDPEVVAALVDQYAMADRYGVRPQDEGWEATYNLNAAAAEGWRMKAGKVAGDFNFSADGASYSKADVLAHCLDMEAKYASLDNGTTRTEGYRDPMNLPAGWDGTLIP